MYINNLDELVPLLKTKLADYLIEKNVVKNIHQHFKCFVHDDRSPSMSLNPKTNYETYTCFSCGAHGDIFTAAAQLDNLPSAGSAWVNETLPTLAKMFEIPFETSVPTEEESKKAKLFKLTADIASIIERKEYINEEYQQLRRWWVPISTISESLLLSELVKLGWNAQEVKSTFVLGTDYSKWFGNDKVTFVIRDYRGRPTGFQSRNIGNVGPKYINSAENPIFHKNKSLYGIDVALKEARSKGLIIVEGPGDAAALNRIGITNVAAICGTAFTTEHYLLIKMLGIKAIHFCLDWDDAGQKNTLRILDNVLKESTGVNCYVVKGPEGYKDPDEFLSNEENESLWDEQTQSVSAFAFSIEHLQDHYSAVDVCLHMIPIIAAESTAIKREMYIQQLSHLTNVSYHSILADVNSIRDNKANERRERLKAVAESHVKAIESDPDNISSLIGSYEQEIRSIEKEYEKDIIGPNYQLARYEAVQQLKELDPNGGNKTAFQMNYFPEFANAFEGGIAWALGQLIYVGGRANSGKTTTIIAVGLDVALSDPDAIVIMHFTDDNYLIAEPRLKTNISRILHPDYERTLSIRAASDPYRQINDEFEWTLYKEADEAFRNLLYQEKLVVIDSEDGTTLSALERQVRYVRKNHPDKKIMIIEDNTHNLSDYGHLEPTARMTRIANRQKDMCNIYRATMIATVEYKKINLMDRSKVRFPVDDDIADARALTYRPNAIIHVYNDLNDRGEDFAETFWTDPRFPDVPQPRLLLLFSKNKISSFKSKLLVNLNSGSGLPNNTVTIKPVKDLNQARIEDLANIERLQKQLTELEEEAEDFFGDEYATTN